MAENFLKVDTVADLIEVSPETVRSWMKKGKIRSYKFGGARRIRETDLLNFARVNQATEKVSEKILNN
ncbi:MAG: helix-turn-helix domain-containing protein [bacterium]